MTDKIVELFWDLSDDVLSMTHSGQLGGRPSPRELPLLPIISGFSQFVLTANVRDDSGTPVGTMSELEVYSEDDSFDVYLTAVLPGRGTLVSFQTKSRANSKGMLPPIPAGQSEWNGERTTVSTTGPEPGRYATVIAATGEFEGLSGLHQQKVTCTHVSANRFEARAHERYLLSF